MPGSGSVAETSKTGTVRKRIRLVPVSSPCSSRSLTARGARMRIAPVALERDQPLVPEAVSGEAVGGAHANPALPAVAGQQLARDELDSLAVGAPARVLLGVG
jgi:hypothetical protein